MDKSAFGFFQVLWKCRGVPNTIILESGATKPLKLNRDKLRTDCRNVAFKVSEIRTLIIGKYETTRRVPENHRDWSHQFLKSLNMKAI